MVWPVTAGRSAQGRRFFYHLLRPAQDLVLPGLAPEGALELPDLCVGLAQLTRRDDVLTGLHRRRRARFRKALPVRITLGEMSSSRLSSASVFSPLRIRWTVVRLNSVLKTRRPSAFRGWSPMAPPATSYVPTVSSRNGEMG